MESKNYQINKLIDRYLNGSLSDTDCKALHNWLHQKKENHLYFKKYCDRWKPVSSDELDEKWSSFRTRIELFDTIDNIKRKQADNWSSKVIHFSRKQFLRYAALIAIGLFSSYLITNSIRENKMLNSSENWITTETLAGQKSKIVLPDSTVVWLNSETRLSFLSGFEKHHNRIVKLEGEAYFDVRDQGTRKFIVRCEDYDVRVHGTEFNVMAYEDFNRTETTLVEGSITVIKGKNKVRITPGERVIYSGKYLTKSKAQVRQATLWKDNKFYFDNIPFRELARRLERWYDVKISLNDPALNNIYYSGYFKNEETVWQVLDVIQMTTPIVYERKQYREIAIDLK